MTKSEFIWIIVRLIGVVFISIALWSFFSFISNLSLLSSMPTVPKGVGSIVMDAIIRITVFVVAGGYLIVDGSLLFGILDREHE